MSTKHLLPFFFMTVLFTVFGAVMVKSQTSPMTKYKPEDITGIWELKDQYEIRIEEHTAILSAIYNKNYPKTLLNNVFYNSINYKSGNTWTANRLQWKFTDGNPTNGRWVNEGEVTLTMSADKSMFTQGSRIFKRK